MAKKFQSKKDKEAARTRAAAHLSPKDKKKADAGGKLALEGGENPRASDESILLHFNEIVKKKASSNSANQKVRSQNAVAKKDNVDTNLLGKVVGYAARPEGDVKFELRELLRYIELCLPQLQLDLFDNEEASNFTREAQIFDEGFRAGRDARANKDDNPHKKGPVEHEIWADGYMYGQKKNASLIGKTKQPKDSLNPNGEAADDDKPTAH